MTWQRDVKKLMVGYGCARRKTEKEEEREALSVTDSALARTTELLVARLTSCTNTQLCAAK